MAKLIFDNLFSDRVVLLTGHTGFKGSCEMHDLVYRFKEKQFGSTVQKFESGYHDGYAKSASIVNLHSVDSLLMKLSLLGFNDIDLIADPETYRSSVWRDKQPLSGVCITANVDLNPDVMVDEESKWIDEYEKWS
jgi:hypothetical protein